MRNLEQYRLYFDQAYPAYAEEQYTIISNLINNLPTIEDAETLLNSDCGSQIFKLIQPLDKRFISYLIRVKELHNNQHQTTYNFRDLDKALMVLGVPKYRISAETEHNNL